MTTRASTTEGGIESDGKPLAVVVLEVGGTLLGIDALAVSRVEDDLPVLPIPRAPAHIGGLVLVGARAVPLIDLARFLALERPSPEETAATRSVVVARDPFEVAFTTRRVSIAERVTVDRISGPTSVGTDALRRFVRGEVEWEGRPLLLVDLDSLLETARV